ncbi:MAG TPA: ABC transporter permease [Vicinamibacteria bacterium]|nr:ABC transporter permease [Vicinamibacteria bacterium]
MNALKALTVAETRLFLRDPATWGAAVILPTFILVILGLIFGNEPAEVFAGRGFLDVFAPSLVVLTVATLSVNTMTTRLATYREKGVLRRLSTAPVRPGALLAAELAINVVAAIVAVALLVTVASVGFGVPWPQNLPGFIVTLGLGTSSLFALALLFAAVVPSASAATAIGLAVFAAVMFLGGVYLPRYLLPEIVNSIGAFTPPGVEGLQDAWLGSPIDVAPLAIMAVITVVAGTVAARMFRWE